MSHNQDQFLNVVDRDTAKQRWWAAAQPKPLGTESIPLANALGRVLGENVFAPVDVPGFDRSNVDGFAVRAVDTFGSEEEHACLSMLNPEEITPGVIPEYNVAPGTASQIATGAMIPRGADAVVMVEQTEWTGHFLLIRRPVPPGANISHAGSDLGRGELVLRRGTRLTSRETGTLAAIGLDSVRVIRRPRVAVISTGNEIIAPGEPLRLGTIHDANATMLSDAVRELGADPIPLGIIHDDLVALNAKLEHALTIADVVLLSGGTSKGTGDLSYRVLAGRSPGVIVHGVALKPGKPICLGVVGSTPVAILPGFPTSAIFTFHELVAPLIRCLAGQGTDRLSTITATLPRSISSEVGRTEALLVTLVEGSHGLVAYPMGKGSGSVTTFARADGYIVIPRERERLDAGTIVEIVPIGEGTRPADLVAIGSHCVGLDYLLSELAEQGFSSKSLWVGSQGGITAVSRDECDLAGVHLLDPVTNLYNVPFLPEGAELVRGYGRMQGLVFRPGDPRFAGKSLVDAIQCALDDPNCLLINRNRGSGTRIVLDELLGGAQPPGYRIEVKSHNAVAAAITQSRADWGLTIGPVASMCNLSFIPVREERYDFMIPTIHRDKPALHKFRYLVGQPSTRAGLARLGFDAHHPNTNLGAVVLCGGQSRRMGRSKAWLPFGPETMLERVVRRVGSVVGRVVVVAAPDQKLPPLPEYAQIVTDSVLGRGPLQGITTGLSALAGDVDWAFATATDVPFLEPLWITRLFELSAHFDMIMPEIGGYQHPLAALYRVEPVLAAAQTLLATDRLRPVFLQELVPTRIIDSSEMMTVDPELRTLRNLNSPEDYLTSLTEAGYTAEVAEFRREQI